MIDKLRNLIIKNFIRYEERLVERVRDAVVGIASDGGYGSGTHIGDGYILTNDHVIKEQKNVIVEWPVNGGREKHNSSAEVIFTMGSYDLAIIRDLNKENYNRHKLSLISNSYVKQGTKVCIIGSPLTLFNTTTFGHITSSYRELDYHGGGSYMDSSFFQTDAAINPGNSGGACVNYYGNLVGVPSAGFPNASNIGFVIKAKSIMEFVNKFRENTNLEVVLMKSFVD